MSTIMKALKRLEHDKQAEAVRAAAHDPLAPALDAPPPKPSTRRRWAGPMAVAAAAAVLGAGLSYGLASWWFSQAGPSDAATDVAAGTPPPSKGPLAVIPDASRGPSDASRAEPAAASPAGGIEAVAQAPAVAPARRAVGRSNVVVQAAPLDPDPWEAAARAAPIQDPAEGQAAGERADETTEAQGASSRASSIASRAASSPGATASSRAAGSNAAPSPPAPSPAPTRRTAHARSIEGARPVSSLPEVTLPEPAASPPAPLEVAKRAAPKPATPAEPPSSGTPKPEPRDTTVKVEAPESRLEIFVVKTVWHPKSERRSARLRISDRVEAIEVREEDVVEGYVVREITPSSVVLARGDVVVTHRVGR